VSLQAANVVAVRQTYAAAAQNRAAAESVALVERATALGARHVASAEERALTHYVQARAEAAANHNRELSAADRQWRLEEVDADATRDRAVAASTAQARREVAQAYYKADLQDDPDSNHIARKTDEAQRKASLAAIDATRRRAEQLAEARQRWTNEVSGRNVALVNAISGAENGEAERQYDSAIRAAERLTAAETAYVAARADAALAELTTQLNAEYVQRTSDAVAEEGFAQSQHDAEAARHNALAGALAALHDALSARHGSLLGDALGSDSFAAQAAAIDNAYRLAMRTAHDSLLIAEAAIDRMATFTQFSLDRTSENADAAATRDFAIAVAQAERDRAVADAEADGALTTAVATAEAQSTRDLARSLGKYDVSLAQATADMNRELAEAGVAWVDALASARGERDRALANLQFDWSFDDVDVQQYYQEIAEINNRYAAASATANTRRESARRRAQTTFDEATALAAQPLAEDQRAAQIASIASSARARADHVAKHAAAEAAETQASANSQAAFEVADAEIQYQNAATSASQSRAAEADRREAQHAYQSAIVGPIVERARALAHAEASVALAAADDEALTLAARRTADPLSLQLAYEASAAEARKAWIQRLTTPAPGALAPYAAYQVERARLDAERAATAMEALAAPSASGVLTSEMDADQSLARLIADRDRSLQQSQRSAAVAKAEADRSLKVALADADAQYAVTGSEATTDAASAIAVSRRAQRIAAAEQLHAQTLADIERSRVIRDASAEELLTVKQNAVLAQRDATLAAWERDATRTASMADADLHIALDIAESELFADHLAAQVAALARLDDALGIPWTNYLRRQAEVEVATWAQLSSQWVQREVDLEAAQLAFSELEAGANAAAAAQRRQLDLAYQDELAQRIAEQASAAAEAEHRYAILVAAAVYQYRRRVSEIDRLEAAARTDDSSEPFDVGPFDDRRQAIADDWAEAMRQAETTLRRDIAAHSQQFVDGVGETFVARTDAVREAQFAAARLIADGRYTAPTTPGYEVTVATIHRDYEIAAATLAAAGKLQLAIDAPSPWSQLEAARAVAQRDAIDLPKADAVYQLQVGMPGDDPLATRAGQSAVDALASRFEAADDAYEAAVQAAASQAAIAEAASATAGQFTWVTPPLPETFAPEPLEPPTIFTPADRLPLVAWGRIDDSYYNSIVDEWRAGWTTYFDYYWAGDYRSFPVQFEAVDRFWFGAGAEFEPTPGWASYQIPHYGWGAYVPQYGGLPPQLDSSSAADVPTQTASYHSLVDALSIAGRAIYAAAGTLETTTTVGIVARTGEALIGVAAWAAEIDATPGDDQELSARYGSLGAAVRRRVDYMGGGAWNGPTVRRMLESMSPEAARFLIPHLRLRLTDDGSEAPTYVFREADQRRTAYHDRPASEAFPEILKGQQHFSIEVQIPASYDDTQAATYLLGLSVGEVEPGAGASPYQLARLFAHHLTTAGESEGLLSNIQQRYRVATEHGEIYARLYYETLASSTNAGGVAFAAYQFERQGVAAGSMEVLTMLPLLGMAAHASRKLLVIIDRTPVAFPAKAIQMIQRGQGVGVDDVVRAMGRGATPESAKEAIEIYLRRNGFSKLVTSGRKTRRLLRSAVKAAPSDVRRAITFANPYNIKVGEAAHHIIPVSVFKDAGLGNWLHGLGIDLNGIDNCVILPTESGKGIIASVHRGDHLGKIYDGKDVV
ncbi:MAG: AHH domain-containing protein, partial [Planctomycetales bacterium]|nr:AHH domain-containing protein [Planctomycetales bacterium]